MFTEKISFKKLSLEVLGIFLGVSAGFLADDYRDYLNDRRQDREILRQLLNDLTLNSADIAPIIPRSVARAEAILWLNNRARAPYPPSDSVHLILNGTRPLT